MKSMIFASFILAASTATGLHIPHKSTPRAASSDTAIPEDTTDSPISKDQFNRLYDIVGELSQGDDYVGLSALNFLTGNALGEFESGEGAGSPAVDKRTDFRPAEDQFRSFGVFFGGHL